MLDAEAFRLKRLKARVPQVDLSARSKVRNDKISRFESGRLQLSLREIAALCGALDALERERKGAS